MPKKSFLEQLQQEVDGIQKELECTEAEAYFTIRMIAKYKREHDESFERNNERHPGLPRFHPEADYQRLRERAVATTKELMGSLNAFHKVTEKGRWEQFYFAVAFCHGWGFPLPKWVSDKFEKATNDYFSDKVATLDEAFGAKRAKHYRLGTNDPMKSTEVYIRCRQLQEEGIKTAAPEYGGGVFKVVGDEYHMSASKVRDIYYKYHPLLSLMNIGLPGGKFLKPMKGPMKGGK